MNEVETMREFFNKLLGQFEHLTGTAQRVAELEQNMNELKDRIGGLEQANIHLARELEQARHDVDAAKAEAQQHRDAAVGANESVKALQDTIANADSRVAKLTEEVRSEVDSHRITKADLEDARKSAQEWESQYVQVKGQVDGAYADRDTALNRVRELETVASDLQSKLDRLTAILNPALHAVA
jgi:chromosome segregation ATPase